MTTFRGYDAKITMDKIHYATLGSPWFTDPVHVLAKMRADPSLRIRDTWFAVYRVREGTAIVEKWDELTDTWQEYDTSEGHVFLHNGGFHVVHKIVKKCDIIAGGFPSNE